MAGLAVRSHEEISGSLNGRVPPNAVASCRWVTLRPRHWPSRRALSRDDSEPTAGTSTPSDPANFSEPTEVLPFADHTIIRGLVADSTRPSRVYGRRLQTYDRA